MNNHRHGARDLECGSSYGSGAGQELSQSRAARCWCTVSPVGGRRLGVCLPGRPPGRAVPRRGVRRSVPFGNGPTLGACRGDGLGHGAQGARRALRSPGRRRPALRHPLEGRRRPAPGPRRRPLHRVHLLAHPNGPQLAPGAHPRGGQRGDRRHRRAGRPAAPGPGLNPARRRGGHPRHRDPARLGHPPGPPDRPRGCRGHGVRS